MRQVGIIGNLLLLIPGISVVVRRLHDLGYSGWWYCILLILGSIPYIGIVLTLGMMLADSRPGTNKYGKNPKQIEFQSTEETLNRKKIQ